MNEKDLLSKTMEEITLKQEINEFLFQVLPETATIKQLDQLAMVIHDQITAIKKANNKKD